jgi:hypothetical protein
MSKFKPEPNRPNTGESQLSLSLKLETTGSNKRNVDADDFFLAAEKWLHALKIFAKEQGQHVKWEIVDLRKSSALVEVQPVTVKTGKPARSLVRKWEQGLRKIEETGKPAPMFTPESLSALHDFVFGIPPNTIASIGNGFGSERHKITVVTQRRIEQAVASFPIEPKKEYVAQGSLRGLLAVLDSWNPDERSFRLKLPMAPTKPVKCTYVDTSLTADLGESFEGMVEITGKLRYKPEHPWPFAAEVEHITKLPRKPKVRLKDLVGLIKLPEGQDSVSYVRSLRDAE